MIYSCGADHRVKSWSIPNKELKYEFEHNDSVVDIVIGREGTPLANKIISISFDGTCRISNLETGAEVTTITFESCCYSIAVNEAQTMIVVGADNNVTFIETTNFTKVKAISFESWIGSLGFNKRNDCMLAVLGNGEVHSCKF